MRPSFWWVRRLSRAGRPTPPTRPRVEALEDRLLLTAYVVTTTRDVLGDTTPGEVTLRDAITALDGTPSGNATVTGTAANSIAFAIPGSGPQTISVGSDPSALNQPLPSVTRQVVLDGWSQGGAGYSGPPLIVLNGLSAGAFATGLAFNTGSDGSVVRGLVIQQFGGDGIDLNGSNGDEIIGNYVGTDASGSAALGNQGEGVLIEAGAANNTVGGTAAGARNVISGNGADGNDISADVLISDPGTSGNLVEGNYVGTDASGTAPMSSSWDGVDVVNGASGNTVGGTAAAARNVISGNQDSGVAVFGAGATGIVIEGNFIGTDKSGAAALGNGPGIFVNVGGNTIGGAAAGAGNVISGNGEMGVWIEGAGASGVVVAGNLIGTDKAGAALGNGSEGVLISGAANNTVGGTAPGARNVISGNTAAGVAIDDFGATGNVVLGNFIGTDLGATGALGNGVDGVLITAAANNTIGGATPAARNVISGNQFSGVDIFSVGSTGNVVEGNYIGTDKSGTARLGNGEGVLLQFGASQNLIGGAKPGSGNRIDFNGKGVVVVGTNSTGNAILGNAIGGNLGPGIDLGDDGPTPNGANPRDFPNFGQNAPLITALTVNSVSGTLRSVPRTRFRLEFFASPVRGPAAQGQVFLGFLNVATGAAGTVSFTAPVAVLAPGSVVTATATNLSTGDTSEFSPVGTQLLVFPPAVIRSSLGAQVVSLTAQLFSGNGPVTSGKVAFTIRGLPGTVTGSVNGNGLVTIRFGVPAGARPGPYAIVTTFAGNRKVDGATADSLLTILAPLTVRRWLR